MKYENSTIEYALLCRSTAKNDDTGDFNIYGVRHRFPVLLGVETSMALVIKFAPVADVVDSHAVLRERDLGIVISGPSKDMLKGRSRKIHWREHYLVETIKVELAQSGNYTIEILDDLVLQYKFSFIVE